MKASIILATYNKNEVLHNTMMGLSKQNISFPYEVCIVDDGSDISPEGIIRKYIPDDILKFKRFEKNVGPINAKQHSYKMASEDSDILVTMACDIIPLDYDCIERLCKGIGEKIFTIAEVNTMEVDPNMYTRWDSEVEKMKGGFSGMHPYLNVYCGSLKPGRWYIFLGAFRREDAEDVNLFGLKDVSYRKNLNKGRYQSVFPMVRAMHQMHISNRYYT